MGWDVWLVEGVVLEGRGLGVGGSGSDDFWLWMVMSI